MHWLNYHHLLYFWATVREGTITAAAEKMLVSQPTVSSQLRELERSVGSKLYETVGRELRLTETGQLVYEYAEEIFSTGEELMSRLRHKGGTRALRFAVGVPDVMPKLIAGRLLESAFRMSQRVHMVCREAKLSELLADLAMHRLDVVLSDSQVGSQAAIRSFNHRLGECGIHFMCTAALAKKYKTTFPECIGQMPLILPTEGTVLRRHVSQWLQERNITPNLVAEVEDSALMKVLAARGLGVVPVADAVVSEAITHFGLKSLGTLEGAKLQFFAISVERKVTHPAVAALVEAARSVLRLGEMA